MRRNPLLTAMPESPVRSQSELFAIAFNAAQTAGQRYGLLAARTDEAFWPIRCVFEVLANRERERADSLSTACFAACGKRPDYADLRWVPIDLVPAAEMAEIADSGLSTSYVAWSLAVRHRQRAFVFWTYVIALAEDPSIRQAAEHLAREALADGNLLRRKRRLAWRAERHAGPEAVTHGADPEDATSAALLESLLLRDLAVWSQGLDPVQRQRLSTLDSAALPLHFPDSAEAVGMEPGAEKIELVQRRALRRAEQLSNIYLEDADRARDQSSMELAQKLASHSIIRLAGLRHLASESGF